jgi:hypothetical protein
MNLRNLLLGAAAASAALTLAGVANAASTTASATASASATIVSPSTLAATRALTFGQIAKPTSGTSTITVASSSSASTTPSISGGNAYVTSNGQAAAAAFHLTGTNGQTYSIDGLTLSFTGEPTAGNLANIGVETPVAVGGSASAAGGTLSSTGIQDLYVGGHFDISSSTAVQTYNGSVVLNVTYN